MIKVATLSFQNAYNYGAVFQVAALQHIITELGADCDIIDYRCPAIDRQYDFLPLRLNRTIINAIRANLVIAPFIRSKKRNFLTWMDSYKKTQVITSKEQLKELNSQYDKFVVGSDQVWNLKCQGHDSSFFLDFVSDGSKKIAYAASFGTFKIDNDDKDFYRRYLKDFHKISVREKSGIPLVKGLGGADSVECIDPVLLAGQEFWKSKIGDASVTCDKYIFVYQLSRNTNIPSFAKQLARDKKLKILFVTGHIGNIVHYSFKDKNISDVSPEMFLSYLANAEYIITDSFHATVLSLVFRKQFFVISKGDERASYNTRIYNLLSDFGLEYRILNSYVNIRDISSEQYVEIENKRIARSKESIDFLKDAIFNKTGFIKS